MAPERTANQLIVGEEEANQRKLGGQQQTSGVSRREVEVIAANRVLLRNLLLGKRPKN